MMSKDMACKQSIAWLANKIHASFIFSLRLNMINLSQPRTWELQEGKSQQRATRIIKVELLMNLGVCEIQMQKGEKYNKNKMLC